MAGGGRSTGIGRGRFGAGDFPGSTYGQQIRLDQSVVREQTILAQVRQYDPNWKPSAESARARPGSIEGAIRESEARTAEAESRLEQLRRGIGGNLPQSDPASPRPESTPSSSTFNGEPWTKAYRAANNMPDLFGQSTWPNDNGTVAVTEIDGRIYFGVNSGAPGYSNGDRAEANVRYYGANATSIHLG